MAIDPLPLTLTEPSDDQEAVAANIRALMGRYRVSQARLAGAVGLSTRGMSERLSGKTNFTVRELGKIARFFGKSISDVVTPLVLSLSLVSFTERGLPTPQDSQSPGLQLTLFGDDTESAPIVAASSGERTQRPAAVKEAA